MKKLMLFSRLIAIGLIMFFSSGWAVGQTTTIDFETEGDGYTPSATEGSSFIDVFNRISSTVGGNASFIWAIENLNTVVNPSITLDQIDITSATSFTFSVDMIAHHYDDWDNTDELIITYSIDGGSYVNLMWVQSITDPASSFNEPAALDTDFDGTGECAYVLPSITTGIGTLGCVVSSSVFETFTTSSIALAGNVSLDIKLQFNGFVSGDEGMYLDDIVIELTSGAPTPTITLSTATLTGFSYVEGSGPSAEQSFTVEGADLTNDISIAASTNYEISETSGSGYTSPITLTQSGGAVSSTTIYVRLKAGLSQGDYNAEDITAASTDATSKTVTCSGSVLSTSSIIINEVDADTDGLDVLEFIELYDGGTGNTSLNGLTLVLFNGDGDISYHSYDLDTYSTDANGYFVLGDAAVTNVDYTVPNGFTQNGADAVALYNGDAVDFPDGTAVSSSNLIDALVYDTGDADDAGLLSLLISGQSQIDEAGNGNSARHSNQRFPNGTGGVRNTSTYGQYFPTPGIENDNWLSTWTGATDTDWEIPGNWSDGIPTANHDVTIPTGKTPIIAASTSANCYDLTLAGTATLTIQSNATNSGSLIIGGTYTGSATAVTYQRYFADINWHMLGSPFTGQTIDASFLSSNNISDMKDYIESETPLAWSTNYTNTAPNVDFSLGKGYATKLSSAGLVSLSGTINNATVNVTLTRTGFGWNLLSNPFTSAIAANNDGGADNLIANNTAALDDSYEAVYIWDGSAYVIINHASSGPPSATLIQNYLQTGQGFFVKSVSPAAGTFTITPAMQSHQTAIAFKSTEESTWASISLNAEISNANASTNILYRNDMNRGLDIGYDAGILKSGSLVLYSRLINDNGIDFGVQCLPTDYEELVVPIGLDAIAGEIITFSAHSLNIPEDYAVVLEDRAMNVFTDLSDEAEYIIQLDNASEGTGRFFVRTSMKSALGNGDIKKEAFLVFTRVNDHQLVIRGEVKQNTSARIYSITGQLMTEAVLELSVENRIPFDGDAGIYLILITSKDGATTHKFTWVK
jgi:hypothetical protein